MMIKRGIENYLVDKLLSYPNKRIVIFREIPLQNQGFILLNLSKKLQKDILLKLKNKEIVELMNHLDPDEVTDLLQLLHTRKRKNIINKLSNNIKEKVEFLLKFDPKTAASIMSLDYIQINPNLKFEAISKIIHEHEKRTGKFPTILVVDNGVLVGELQSHKLAIGRPKEKITKYITKVPHIEYDKDTKEVIKTFRKHPHNKIVVLDNSKEVLGIIYSDDILKIIDRQSANTLRDFAGVNKEEDVQDSGLLKVKYRYKWLIINLFTAFIAASVVGLFKETISKYVLLAVYMPIVTGMGGNAGTQTLAVVVRGLALKEINFKSAKRVILNELFAGGVNGLINGIIVAIIASVFNKNPILGLIIGLSMVSNLLVSAFFGVTIPLLMEYLGKDPASSATIFITTATDVFGFFVFLGLASIML